MRIPAAYQCDRCSEPVPPHRVWEGSFAPSGPLGEHRAYDLCASCVDHLIGEIRFAEDRTAGAVRLVWT